MSGRDWTLLVVLTTGLAASGAAFGQSAEPEAFKFSQDRLEPGLYPGTSLAEPPAESTHLPFDVDWSLGLKGTYTSSSTEGGSFSTVLTPLISAVHDGRQADITVNGDAEIIRPWDGSGTIGVTALRLGVSGESALDSTTLVSGNAALEFSQDLPSTPGLNPGILTPPQVLTGTLGAGIERSFGRFNVGLKGNLDRSIYGETLRSDTGWTDNSGQNVWQADMSLRAGVEITPIFEAFSEASMGRDIFDMPAPATNVRADATNTALRGGISGSWNGVWRASASVGIGHYNFDDPSLSDIVTQLYDASLTYSPDPTISLTAALSTNVEPTGADRGGTAGVVHTASTNLAYEVNSWLRLRASADWGLSRFEGTSETEHRSGVGAGADYVLNAHTAVSADYRYANRDNSVSGQTDTHSVSLGVTVKR